MNRRDLRQLAELRIREAKALLRARCAAGAYYLGGYGVECALKACIAKQTRRFDFPDKRIANRVWTHDLKSLLELANLGDELERQPAQTRQYWNTVQEWSEAARYQTRTLDEARDLVRAAADSANGVVIWIKRYW